MSSKQNDPLLFGKVQTEAMFNLQKGLLDEYAEASRTWLDRVKSEVELWSELPAKVTTARSVLEFMQVYQKCVAAQMEMNAEDGRRLLDDCQRITQKIAGSLNGNRWPTGSTRVL
jgi:hypothetical protein